MAPMTTFSANTDDSVSDAEIDYYRHRSKGVSLVLTACAYVTPNGKGFPGQFGAESDDRVPSLKRLATAIQEEGAKAVLQIYHGGKLCPAELVPNDDIVSASDVPATNGHTARALTITEIEEIIAAFGQTTRRAIEAGYDGVEIHGANGYLLHQFFSPYSNQREDEYGGSLENRMRFPLAIIDEVKRVVAEYATAPFLIGYRFSPEEEEETGFTMADTLAFVDVLAEQGLDYLHVSLNHYSSKPRRGVEDRKRPRIDYLVEKVNGRVPFIGVGSVYNADAAYKAFDYGIDLLALGRGLLMDPEWVQKLEEDREQEIIQKLDTEQQHTLVIPDELWKMLLTIPGWLPLKK